jgi:hypothetical protein
MESDGTKSKEGKNWKVQKLIHQLIPELAPVHYFSTLLHKSRIYIIKLTVRKTHIVSQKLNSSCFHFLAGLFGRFDVEYPTFSKFRIGNNLEELNKHKRLFQRQSKLHVSEG